MWLHRLTLTAFGPFPGTEEIDFDELSGAGLFLIRGQTGAGKTSVLDAVCFALYGRVPGLRNQAKTLHSDHAPRDRAPRVELEFTIRGRRLRVHRSPEWARPKKRGAGETREHAAVTVEELAGGGWSPLTTRLDEAGQLLGDLMGMSAEQFCQVALLPQGEFARFLRAGAEDRRGVLERLFATEVYAGVEAWLADRRTRTWREAEALHRAATGVADRVSEVAGDLKIAPAEEPAQLALGEPEPPRADERPEDPGDLPGWAALLDVAARDALTAAEAELAAATKVAERVRADTDAARTRAERRRRHADAMARRAALDARAPERARLTAVIDAAHRAATVRPLLDAADARARTAEAATREAAEALAAVTAFLHLPPELLNPTNADSASAAADTTAGPFAADPASAAAAFVGRGGSASSVSARIAGGAGPGGLVGVTGPLLAFLQDAERERRDEAARLDGLRAEAARLRDVRRRVRDAETERTRLDAEETRLAAALAELPGRCAELETARDAAREKGAGLAAADAAIEAAEARLAAATRRDALRDHLAAARTHATAATDTAQDLRDELQHVRAARIAGMAAELAANLADGEACPVCGSAAHPAPAHPAEGAPTQEAERAAEEAYETARIAREAAEKQITEVSAALDAAAGQAGDRTVADATAELDTHRRARADAAAARTEADRLDAALKEKSAELDGARRRATEITAAVAELRTRATALAEDAERVTAVLDAARGVDATIEARADRLTTEAAALRTAADAIGRAETARREHADARRAATEAALTAGFPAPTATAPTATAPTATAPTATEPNTTEPNTTEPNTTEPTGPTAQATAEPAAELTAGPTAEPADVASYEATERAAAAGRPADEDARGLAAVAAVRRALLGDAELAAAGERRRALDAEEATVRDLLADPELVAAAAQPAPDLDAAEAALAAATDARTAAASARDHARGRHTRLVELGAELGDRVAQWRPAARRHAVAARMAALTAGTAAENRAHMKLSAYVLAARLEQVVAAANQRLARMSGGRYLLEHTTDRAKGDRRVGSGGLGLKVVDTWTMRPREPATLSGGETFICSLALALGLADVVTAEAGGAEIATLFVDEGFGSLDADTLDEVMDVLDDLRDGGRAVGVVSHVAELRARITAQLVVHKDRTGSTLAAVV